MGDKMKVSLLGSFEIEYNGEKLLYHDYRSKQITKLLTYLILNRKKQIFNTTTADIMFNDHDSNDPINALKALVYRVRCVLKKSFGDEQFILNAKGSYYWNPNIDVLVMQKNSLIHLNVQNLLISRMFIHFMKRQVLFIRGECYRCLLGMIG